MPDCAAVWNAAQTKADAAYEAYRSSDLKDEKKFEDSKTIRDNADTGYCKCSAPRVKEDPFSAEITKQAQEPVDRVRYTKMAHGLLRRLFRRSGTRSDQ